MRRVNRKSNEFIEILRIVGRGRKLQRDLTREEAAGAMRLLLGDEISDAQIGAFLVTMRVKEETAEELAGFVEAAREQLSPSLAPRVEGLVDLALPYDGKESTLQTGVAAGLVLAALGVPVLMHGADDIPAKRGVGPLQLLRALGHPADLPPHEVERQIEDTGFGVLNLAQVLPRWTDLTPLRHHFGLRTLLNTVEKLLNPANAPLHISAFYHGNYLLRMAAALPGTARNWIIQGEEGSIDIRPGKKTRIFKAAGNDMIEIMLNATDYGFSEIVPLETPPIAATHAEIIGQALAGEAGPAADQIALTAGTLLWMTDAAADVAAGIEQARRALADGRVRALLERTIHPA